MLLIDVVTSYPYGSNAKHNNHCVKIHKSLHELSLSILFGTTDIGSSLYTRIIPAMMIGHVGLSYTKITPTIIKKYDR